MDEARMPYFTRRPYAEMLSVGPAASEEGAEDIVAMAAGVLGLAPDRTGGVMRPKQALRAGGSGTILLGVSHEPGTAPVATGLLADDMHGPSGSIPSEAITIAPAFLTLANGASADVRVTIRVPPGTSPGMYLGLIRSEIDDGFAERIAVEVVG